MPRKEYLTNTNWLIWLVIIIGFVLVLIAIWYWKTYNQDTFADTTTTTPTSNYKPTYPFIWRIDEKGQFTDKNNQGRHQAILYKDSTNTGNVNEITKTKKATFNEGKIINEKTTTTTQGIKLDFKGQIIGLNVGNDTTEYDTTEYLQLLPSTSNNKEWIDYKILENKILGINFAICMWVRFPSVRSATTNDGLTYTGQSECLVEIMNPGAENDMTTGKGGYFTILRATSNNGTNNNKISCGFSDPKMRITSQTEFNNDSWNHITVSFVAGLMTLYVNGIQEGKGISIINIDKNKILLGEDTIFNIGKNSKSLLTTKNCDACSYAKFYLADLQLYNTGLVIPKQICMFSDITKTLKLPYNWIVSKIDTSPAFIDENNTPYNFKIDGINKPISSDTINKQIKFDEQNGLVNITNNFLQFLPQRYILPDKTLYDNTVAWKNYEFMNSGFKLEIKCKFSDIDAFGKPTKYTPFSGQSEYIMEFFNEGAQNGTKNTGGYLFIARRPLVNGKEETGYTNYVSVGVLGKEIRSNNPITDFTKIHSFRIELKRPAKDKNELYFYLNDVLQRQFVDNKNNKNIIDFLTLLDSELPIIETTTKYNIGYGSREKNKTTGLSVKSVYLSDLAIRTTTEAQTTTTEAQTTTTEAQTTPSDEITAVAGPNVPATGANVVDTAATAATGTIEPTAFKWSIAIKNGINIMGAGQDMQNNQIVALIDVKPSNTSQQTKLDIYEGDIVGINMRQNTTTPSTNAEYLQFLPNPTMFPTVSNIIGFRDYQFLTPTEQGQGFTISMNIKFKLATNTKSETLFEFFDPSNATKYFYIKRLGTQDGGGDKNKIVAGYSNYSGYAKSISGISDNLWYNIVITCANDKKNNQNLVVVSVNGESGTSVDFDYPRCVFSLTDKAIINIGKKSYTANLPNDNISTTPANSYTSCLLADLQLIGKVLNATQIKTLATTSISGLPIDIKPPVWNPSMFSFATVPVSMS
jgi:hypothetical protein